MAMCNEHSWGMEPFEIGWLLSAFHTQLLKLLTRLTQKIVSFLWDTKCDKSIYIMKEKLAMMLLLTLTDSEKEY